MIKSPLNMMRNSLNKELNKIRKDANDKIKEKAIEKQKKLNTSSTSLGEGTCAFNIN